MLFHSPEFIFIFLPLTWLLYRGLTGIKVYRGALAWLVLASLVFYGYWNPPYVILICGSILVNYSLGRGICPHRVSPTARRRRWLLLAGLILNLGLLGYFKYANFFVDTANRAFGTSFNFEHVILPLAISFFTFTQIAYLCDAFKGETRGYGLLDYSFFVTFFPHLIAGPIVQHYEIMPQVERGIGRHFQINHLTVGLSVFVVGLFKKMVLADQCAIPADSVFKIAALHGAMSPLECWAGVLAYSFQLYFDFSGYSDMAIGLSYCFGFRLPINFDSPYRATNIIDFWRRWHISLSRFLKKYLYFPLGGNRHGVLIRYRNLFLTMLLGGLWHGAGWNFVIWGGLHGTYLMINHYFADHWKGKGLVRLPTWIKNLLGWAVTFFAVTIAWVFFRASNLESAGWLLQRMFGFGSGVVLPDKLVAAVSSQTFVLLVIVGAIAFLAPGSQRYFSRVQPALEKLPRSFVVWRPSLLHGLLLGVMIFFIARRYFLLEPTSFLYFNF